MREFSYQLEGYTITVYGGGVAYSVQHNSEPAAVAYHVQGDDALQFEQELERALESHGEYRAADFLADCLQACQ